MTRVEKKLNKLSCTFDIVLVITLLMYIVSINTLTTDCFISKLDLFIFVSSVT